MAVDVVNNWISLNEINFTVTIKWEILKVIFISVKNPAVSGLQRITQGAGNQKCLKMYYKALKFRYNEP